MGLRLFYREHIYIKRLCLLGIWILLFFLPFQNVSAQDYMIDSLFYQKAISRIHAQYSKNIGANAGIYQGMAYDHYWNKVLGSPFFLNERLVPGIILYDGAWYENVPLAYDLLKGVVVTRSFSNDADISLVGERVNFFSIDGHEFIRLVKDSNQTSLPNSGFYERLYMGKASVFEKREKKIKQSLKAEDNITGFVEYDEYYIQKDSRFYRVESESDLQRIFKDQRVEIRKLLNRRDMHFTKDPAKVIIQVAAYYSNLKKGNAH